MLRDLVERNRSYRRFHEDEPITRETLVELVDLARLTPSAANRQPLRYILSCDPDTNARVFQYLAWAGYLKDWPGPEPGERPSAYIVILLDTTVSQSAGCDHGIAAQTILLGATERGLGGCMIGAIDRMGLQAALGIPERYEILLAIALGRPKERVKLEPVPSDGDIRYYRDSEGIHHVPKRGLEEIIIG